MFLHHFVDLDPRVKYLKKSGQQKKGSLLWNEGYWQLCTLALEVKESFMQSLSAFLLFFLWQEKLLKVPLACTFIPRLLNFYDMPSLFRNEKKIHTKAVHTKAVVNMSRGAKEGESFWSCPAWLSKWFIYGVRLGGWRKLWSLVQLCQKIKNKFNHGRSN